MLLDCSVERSLVCTRFALHYVLPRQYTPSNSTLLQYFGSARGASPVRIWSSTTCARTSSFLMIISVAWWVLWTAWRSPSTSFLELRALHSAFSPVQPLVCPSPSPLDTLTTEQRYSTKNFELAALRTLLC